MEEANRLARLMYFLEMDINQNAKGDALLLDGQPDEIKGEWQGYAEGVIKFCEVKNGQI